MGRMIDGPGSLPAHKYWGYALSYNLDAAQQRNYHRPGGGARSGLALTDLVELLKTAFINQDVKDNGAIVIFLDSPTEACLNETVLVTDDWTRIGRFTQLWRTTGWLMREVDQAISGLRAMQKITQDFLLEIVAVKKLVELAGVKPEVLLSFWMPIDTKPAKNSLYARLFLPYYIHQRVCVFTDGTWLDAGSGIMILEHERAVEATLGLTKEGLDAIKDGVIGNDSLSIENISTLYRYCTLARLLNTTPAVLLQVITLVRTNPFRYATSCLQFFELWKQMEAAGLPSRSSGTH